MSLIPAVEASQTSTYFVPENGIEVRVTQTEKGPSLENVDTGGCVLVAADFMLSPEPGVTAAPDAIQTPTKAPERKAARPPMGRVSALKTNIQGGVEVEFDSSKVILYGPNGSSKTTIARGLELAGSAAASDIAGRTVTTKPSMLLPLIDPNRDTSIESEMAVLHDGVSKHCSYSAALKGGGKVSKPDHDTGGLNVVFPLREVQANLRGSAEKAQAWLLKIATTVTDRKTLVMGLNEEAGLRFPKILDPTASIEEALLHASTEAPKLARQHTAAAKKAGTLADERAARLGLRPAPEEVERAEVQAHQLKTQADTVVATMSVFLTAPTAEQTETRRKIEEWLAANPIMEMASPAKQGSWAAALRLMQVTRERGDEKCSLCSGALPHETQEAIFSGLEHAIEQQEQIAAVAAEHHRLNVILQRIPTGEAANPEVQAQCDAATSAAEEARQRVNNLLAQVQGWDEVDNLRQRARNAESEARVYQFLAKELKAAVGTAVEGATSAFTSRVQSLLPKEDRFWLDAKTGRYGLAREVKDDEGTYSRRDSALCGAEWARVTLAIAGAATPADAELSILIPEDRAWDPKTLRSSLVALTDYPGMVVVTTTVKPFRGAPKGWQMIELEGN